MHSVFHFQPILTAIHSKVTEIVTRESLSSPNFCMLFLRLTGGVYLDVCIVFGPTRFCDFLILTNFPSSYRDNFFFSLKGLDAISLFLIYVFKTSYRKLYFFKKSLSNRFIYFSRLLINKVKTLLNIYFKL